MVDCRVRLYDADLLYTEVVANRVWPDLLDPEGSHKAEIRTMIDRGLLDLPTLERANEELDRWRKNPHRFTAEIRLWLSGRVPLLD